MKVTVCSPCFYPSRKYAEPLLASAKRHHFKAQLYGVGEPFINYYDAKVLRLRKLLREIKTRYSIYIDCRDVLWLDGLQKVLDGFFATRDEQKKDVLIGTEIDLWPFQTAEFYKWFNRRAERFGGSPFRYPAPGMIVGRTDAILAVLDDLITAKPLMEAEMAEQMKPKLVGDDMPIWNWGLPRGKVQAALDYQCRITTVMRPEFRHKFVLENGRVRCTDTGQHPVVLHFNCQNRNRNRALMRECREKLWA